MGFGDDLYCFEWMSVMRINYHKSKVYAFGIGKEREMRCANMLRCNLGELPLTHLDIPMSNRHLGFLPSWFQLTLR
jgi:hypothetical protein